MSVESIERTARAQTHRSDDVELLSVATTARLDSVQSTEAGEAEALLHDARLYDEQSDGRPRATDIDRFALACLLLQHMSNTFVTGVYEFAAFLFLIEIYRDTLIPASLVGLFSKLAGLIFSGYIGGIVDSTPRLRFVRVAIVTEKALNVANYALFLVLFGPLRSAAQATFHGRAGTGSVVAVWGIILATVAFSSVTVLANTGLTVAVERDWVMTIGHGNEKHLTLMNTYMRRIDLFSKLVAPLFVSLLTTTGGYSFATATLLGMCSVSLLMEFWWIEVVFDRFPELRKERGIRGQDGHGVSSGEDSRTWLQREMRDWLEFSRLPIFASSFAIGTIYLTTLSYDGTFIAYIKAVRAWDDTFIAGMRGICVVTGLIGTVVMPVLEKRIGLERAGAWSIWFEIGCLLPVLVSFFVGSGKYGERGPAWNSIVLFGGIALSRIGLWSFDLCQLKELQIALDDHPRRNRMTALQISLQNLFDLAKYAVTLAASSPRQFKWTAVVSFGALFAGGVSYAVYLRKVRGHLLHLEWLKKGG